MNMTNRRSHARSERSTEASGYGEVVALPSVARLFRKRCGIRGWRNVHIIGTCVAEKAREGIYGWFRR